MFPTERASTVDSNDARLDARSAQTRNRGNPIPVTVPDHRAASSPPTGLYEPDEGSASDESDGGSGQSGAEASPDHKDGALMHKGVREADLSSSLMSEACGFRLQC